ncbi:MAG: hypothetical protein JWM80_2807 [Cyanobacteria bacterium RYN_339]|nr:hypothetical protein [Cyanobacteria bacterium RYN_339]
MSGKIIRFPALTTNAEDPAMARTLFFAEVECNELVHVIPAAKPAEAKAVY